MIPELKRASSLVIQIAKYSRCIVRFMTLVEVAKASDIPKGGMIHVTANGRDILLANVGGTIYAMDNNCSHRGAPMHEGILEGHIITCPWHEGSFDIRTGKASSETAWVTDLEVWPVKVQGDNVFINL